MSIELLTTESRSPHDWSTPHERAMEELTRPLCPDTPSLWCGVCRGHEQEGLLTAEHRWLLDEAPWPEQAALVYGELVELTTPHPPIPKLGWLGSEIVGSRSVIVACVIEQDERDGDVGPLYVVETEVRPEFLLSRGALHADIPPRYRSDLPEGTSVRIRWESDTPGATTEAAGQVTDIWWTTSLEPPKGYIVQVGEFSHCVTPQQTEVL